MAVIRRRYLFWLLKAYFKKAGKQFFIFFIAGLFIFLLLLKYYPLIFKIIPLQKKLIIGIAGSYTSNEIPQIIIEKVSRGLTRIEKDGTVKPDLARSWKVEDKGKKYIFNLKKNIYFSDDTLFTSKKIKYSFTDVNIQKPDDYTIIYTLKEAYAPFLVTVSMPILYNGYIGIGEYKINNIELNGDFIKSIQLISRHNNLDSIYYEFYPTTESLKTAFVLGEVTSALDINDFSIKDNQLTNFSNVTLDKNLNTKQLVTLFFNTQDPILSDKKLRNGLSYALPDHFSEGVRNYQPYSPQSKFYNNEITARTVDYLHAKLLVNSALESASISGRLKITIKSLSKYISAANNIKNSWNNIGIETVIEEVDSVPFDFQIFLGDFTVPKDPDQYTLWHSGQKNNITRFKNLRIDKLLEDGRKIIDLNERIKIYDDFQKYLLDESPASFLYFPYQYDIRRN